MQTASEIPGLLPEKRDIQVFDTVRDERDIACQCEGFDKAIDVISHKRLGVVINKEKLVDTIMKCPQLSYAERNGGAYLIADAIIQAAKDKDLATIKCVE